jgi:hypothetical protein
MLTTAMPNPTRNDLERTVEDRITQRIGRRLRWLRVVKAGPHILVLAVSPSYYVKQLLMQTVLEMRNEEPDLAIEFDIDVR